jgi:hypothetical protein
MQCLHSGADYNGILVSGIQLEHEYESSGENQDGIL